MPMTVAVPPFRSMPKRLLGGDLETDGFERVMHTAAGQLLHLSDGVALRSVDHVRRAELPGQLELARHHVHGDHPGRTGDGGTVDTGQANAATADDGDRGAGLHLGGVDDRANAGRDPATDQSRPVEGHVFTDLRHRVLVHQHVLGEGAQVGELLEHAAGLAQPGFFPFATPRFRLLAQGHVTREAVLTVSAEHRKTGDHVIARFHVVHVGADLLDDACAFMAEDHGRDARVGTIEEMQIAVTNTGSSSADQHFPRSRLGDVDVLDLHGLIDFPEYGSLHTSPLIIEVSSESKMSRARQCAPRSGRWQLTPASRKSCRPATRFTGSPVPLPPGPGLHRWRRRGLWGLQAPVRQCQRPCRDRQRCG